MREEGDFAQVISIDDSVIFSTSAEGLENYPPYLDAYPVAVLMLCVHTVPVNVRTPSACTCPEFFSVLLGTECYCHEVLFFFLVQY